MTVNPPEAYRLTRRILHFQSTTPTRPMSVTLQSVAWKLSFRETSSLKFVLISLCDHADDDGWGVYPSIAYTALRTDLSERTVQRAFRQFERIGLLIVVRKATAYPPMPAEYRINVTLLRDLARENQAVWLQLKERQKRRGDTVSPLGLFDGITDVDKRQKRGDTVSERGDTKGRTGVTPRHPNLKSESLEEPGKKKSKRVDNPKPRPAKATPEAAAQAIASIKWDARKTEDPNEKE